MKKLVQTIAIAALLSASLALPAEARERRGPSGRGAYVVIVDPERPQGATLTAAEYAAIQRLNESCHDQIAAQVPGPAGAYIREGIRFSIFGLIGGMLGSLAFPGASAGEYGAYNAAATGMNGMGNAGPTRRYAWVAAQSDCMRQLVSFRAEREANAGFLYGVFVVPWYVGDARGPVLRTTTPEAGTSATPQS